MVQYEIKNYIIIKSFANINWEVKFEGKNQRKGNKKFEMQIKEEERHFIDK